MSPERKFWNVRSFPLYKRNCYSFTDLFSAADSNKAYLVRAMFMYGNYDGKNYLPEFDIFIGTQLWDTVEFENASAAVMKEIFYTPKSEDLHVCLYNTNKGRPFISVLELRLFDYLDSDLELFARFDIGSQDGKKVRYPDDAYDRIWTPYNSNDWRSISTSLTVNVKSDDLLPPSSIMRTAATPANSNDSLYLQPKFNASTYNLYFHFADFEKHKGTQIREFDIIINGDQLDLETVQPQYLNSTNYTPRNFSNDDLGLKILIKKANRSGLPPILNAIEIYTIREDLSQHETNKSDYDAIKNIKSYYRIKRNWQGDPCFPKDCDWEGLKCDYGDGSMVPSIISLNLSSSGLTGNISEHISNLKWLEYLDLSHNNLTGVVPDVLSNLESMKVLKLEGNNLSGAIPHKLLQNERLEFSCGGNPNLSCKKRTKHKVVIPLAASLSGAFILCAAITFWVFKRRQPHKAATLLNKPNFELPLIKGIESNKQKFTYEEVNSITNNFERVLGKGGFGTVYHGYIATTQVAVKLLSPSAHGYLQFQTEAELLTRVHHKCLTALVGYCEEGTNVALIYEYMANGDLADHLSGKSGKFLGWKQRLQIAADAAEGLEYLHNGCKPPIVHRDIKPQNILLNENMRGKLADFGLSRIFSDEDDTHISTVIAGTLGYLDPEYYMSNRLNEKSDVFSFGVVLLEIITGQPAIARTEERTHIIQRLDSFVAEGDIHGIVDPRLQGQFCPGSAKKVLDTAMACVESTSTKRPNMSQVVKVLKECLGMVMTVASDAHATIPDYMIDVSFDMISVSSLAR